MPIVYLGLGSNRQPTANIRLGAREIRRRFDLRIMSSVYSNKAVGFEGEDFLNAVAAIETSLTPGAICQVLEEIHAVAGRQRGNESFESRTLDIDLLLYDDLVIDGPPTRLPREDVLKYSFVLGPLAEIAPDFLHPVTGKSIARHWAEFDSGSHPLHMADLTL